AGNTDAWTVDTTPPAAPTLALVEDTGASDSDGITNNGTITVGALEDGADWEYSLDGGDSWQPGSGDSFELPEGDYAADQVRVRQTDLAGNLGDAAGNTDAWTVDTTPPAAPTLALEEHTGPIDGITQNGSIVVDGIESETSWEYSLDGGESWQDGSGDSFELPEGDYPSGQVQVRQRDIAGNTSPATSNDIDWVIDAAPYVPPEEEQDRVPNPDGTGQGDGNGDGIPDRQQEHVVSQGLLYTSTPRSRPGDAREVFITLAAEHDNADQEGARLFNLAQWDAPDDPREDLEMPVGMISFEANLPTPGIQQNFSLFLEGGVLVNGYWKQDAQGDWINLASPEHGGRTYHMGNKTRLDFVIEDGGPFDADGLANGTIVDPGAPGMDLVRQFEPGPINAGLFDDDHPLLPQLYQDLLGRDADAEGLAFWEAELESGQMDRFEVLAAMLDSPEFQQGTGLILQLYQGLLSRSADPDGLAYWMGVSQQEQSESHVVEHFMQSTEFTLAWGQQDDSAFVEALYQELLDRDPDAEGEAYWLSQLTQGQARHEVIAATLLGEEAQQGMAASLAVDALSLRLFKDQLSLTDQLLLRQQWEDSGDNASFHRSLLEDATVEMELAELIGTAPELDG
ncbi:DUF4214 domain-containing protein, partial [Halomonas campisalis]